MKTDKIIQTHYLVKLLILAHVLGIPFTDLIRLLG